MLTPIFFDIETIPQSATEKGLEIRSERYRKNDQTIPLLDHYNKNAALHAEFWQIVCISASNGKKVISFDLESHKDEKWILDAFIRLCDRNPVNLCGHNIKNFDIPFIVKRCIVHGIRLPHALNTHRKKPRQLTHIYDTLEMRKWLGYQNTALQTICFALWLPDPKDEVCWSDVAGLIAAGEYAKVSRYCEGDVLCAQAVFERMIECLV